MRENRLSLLPIERVTWGKGDRIVKISKKKNFIGAAVKYV